MLGKIVEEVKEDFKEILEQKKGTIELTGHCEASVIPFQFRQLVYNIISNSLKFSRPGIPMVITIESRIAEGKDCSERLLPDIKYHHLTFTDNGIGFDTQYLDEIFVVFKRLHSQHEYQGSGIGLSICKKIVEKHNGYITAHSKLNEGSTFVVTLPEKIN